MAVDFAAPFASSRVRDLFERIVDRRAAEREALIAAAALTHSEAAVLRALLAADGRDVDAFDTPVADWIEQLDDEPGDFEAMVGRHAGPYRLLKPIGKGGSAIVFRAARRLGDAEQTVALKLLHHGLFAPESRRRFRREQAILTQLSHPNIARLIDAGITETGTPYIAMEEIDGVDLIAYADAHALGAEARLRLLAEVCLAVDAAHRMLVVHRDLKPSNVLVTRDGRVKVLDFGIAKMLDGEEAATATLHVALTPGYAAPEQYDQGVVTTSTDVYALGVLASELMLGVRLDADAAWPDLADEHRADAWRRWRRLDAEFVDMLRAMLASEPARRYASAGRVADDIGRYLRREPLAVRPLSRWYRARKFVARHRVGVAAAALLALAALGVTLTTLWQSGLARREAARANAARDFLVSVFDAAGPDQPRELRPSVQEVVDHASDRLLGDSSLPDSLRVDLLLTLARVAGRVGSYARAQALLDQGEAAMLRLQAEHSPEWLQARVLRAGVLSGSTSAADVEALLAPLRADLLASRDANGIDGLLLLANARMEAGDHDDAIALVRSAEANARSAALPGSLLSALVSDARTLEDAQRFGESVEKSDEALAVWRSQGAPPNPDMVDLYGAIALGAEATGDMARAEAAGRDGIALGERIFDRPTRGFAWVVHEYGTFLVTQGRFAEGEPYLRRALDMRTAMFGAADPNTLDVVGSIGKMYYWQGRFADSVRELDPAVAACGDHAIHDVVCARVLALRARSLARGGRHAEAAADARAALAQQLEFGDDRSAGYAWILDNVAVTELARGAAAAALATADRVLAIRGSSHTGMVLAELVTRFTRARALFELRRDREALAELDAIEPQYAGLYPRGGMHFDLLRYRARALARAQRVAEAREDAKRALELASGRDGVDAEGLAELRALAAAPLAAR